MTEKENAYETDTRYGSIICNSHSTEMNFHVTGFSTRTDNHFKAFFEMKTEAFRLLRPECNKCQTQIVYKNA